MDGQKLLIPGFSSMRFGQLAYPHGTEFMNQLLIDSANDDHVALSLGFVAYASGMRIHHA